MICLQSMNKMKYTGSTCDEGIGKGNGFAQFASKKKGSVCASVNQSGQFIVLP